MEGDKAAQVSTSLEDLIELAAILCGQRDEKKIGKRIDEKEEKQSKQQSLGNSYNTYFLLIIRHFSPNSDQLKNLLERRLDLYYGRIGNHVPPVSDILVDLQQITGKECLLLLEKIVDALNDREGTVASSSSSSRNAPNFGSRDRQTLKILLEIINNWSLVPSIVSYDQALSFHRYSITTKLQELQVEEETNKRAAAKLEDARMALWPTVSRLDRILNRSSPPQDDQVIHSMIYSSCSVNILAAGIRVGWGPVEHSVSNHHQQDDIAKKGMTIVAGLLKGMTTSTALKIVPAASSIGAGEKSSAISFVKPVTGMLFSAQLLRPDGVMALLRNTFANDDPQERGMMKRLVSIGHLLTNPPVQMPLPVFAAQIVPRLLEVLGEMPKEEKEGKTDIPSLQSTSAQKNAASFTLSRFYELAPKETFHLMCIHLLDFIGPTSSKHSHPEEDKVIATEVQIIRAVKLLNELVNQSEPSSSLVFVILNHVFVPLFVLYSFLKEQAMPSIETIGQKGKQRQTDQWVEIVYELLITFLRLASAEEATKMLSPLHQGIFGLVGKPFGMLSADSNPIGSVAPQLQNLGDGQLQIVWNRRDQDTLDDDTTLEALGNLNIHEMDIDIQHTLKDEDQLPEIPRALIDALKLVPSPIILADLLKRSERKSVAAGTFVNLLDACALTKQRRKLANRNDGLSSHILHVQCMLQLIDTFGSQILQDQPEKVLEWIAFMLNGTEGNSINPAMKEVVQKQESRGEKIIEEIPFIRSNKASSLSPLSDLLNVEGSENCERSRKEESQSSDEPTNEEDEEMIETALNLLLSLLEGDTTKSLESHSMLKVINARVNALTTHSNDGIRPIAKEASLVLKARESTQNVKNTDRNRNLSSPHEQAIAKGNEMYQEALKMLQDPILPVRAHGLVVLKDLTSYGSNKDEEKEIVMDPALIPAILDIFIQAICDDESFLYLNAVKGLSEMANAGGRSMIQKLITLYVGEENSGTTYPLQQAEVDKRLRIGEAILQVVQKLEEALSAFTSEIVDPLLNAIRKSELSTTLRTSMLSILGTCIEACPQAMAIQGHAKAIGDGMMDLLSIEMDTKGRTTQDQMDNATLIETKLPQLRRAALVLLSLLIRGSTLQFQASHEDRQNLTWRDDGSQLSALRMPGGGTLSPLKTIVEKGSPDQSKNNISLFSFDQVKRCEQIVGYVAQFDRDALAQHQANEVLQDLETFKLYIIHTSAGSL